MEIREGTIIKATTMDGREVHGFVMYDEDMNFFVTGENPVLLESLTNIRLSEDAPKGNVVDQILNADIKKVDAKKVKDAEKLGAEREKELIKMKVLKGNEGYKDKFAAGVQVAKALNGKGGGLFNKSCLDKVAKKESLENMENTSWENFKEGDLDLSAGTPIEGDTIIGEMPLETNAEDTVVSVPTAASVDTAVDTSVSEPVAPITDMTVNNTMIDDGASSTTPQVGDDILSSSDSITDYSQFLDSNSETDATSIVPETSTEEDDLISNAISTEGPTTVSSEDVQITIKNPSNKSIEIKINGEKEDVLNAEIDKELDAYSPEEGYTDAGFLEHLCRKYDYNTKLVENMSVSSAICKLISDVANK